MDLEYSTPINTHMDFFPYKDHLYIENSHIGNIFYIEMVPGSCQKNIGKQVTWINKEIII